MRVVVIGLGIQGRKRLAVAGKDVVATVDSQVEEAKFRSIENVPLDSFEAALLCVPDNAKLNLLFYLCRNGKHVLMEKPLLANESEISKLEALARETQAVCYVAYNHRFEPHFVEMQKVLATRSLGEIYRMRLFYGNGTARNVRGSWRDKDAGVLTDLGSHLLDTTFFWLGQPPAEAFQIVSANRFENNALDHVVIASNGVPSIELEMTLCSWRNSFVCDVYGEHGSAHIDSLCKWGPSRFTVHRRKLPSGRPDERTIVLYQDDLTWDAEYAHFQALCSSNRPVLLNKEKWISTELERLAREASI